MPCKRHTPEQIIGKLREAEVLLGQGATIPAAAKQIGITEQTYYRWRAGWPGPLSVARKRGDAEKASPREVTCAGPTASAALAVGGPGWPAPWSRHRC
jgi:transposase-like protein